MSDLPTRERVSEAVTFAHVTDADGDVLMDVAQVYVEGRLVDREATNYEAAYLAYYRSWGDKDSRGVDPRHLTAIDAAVDAALGDTG